MYLLVAVQVVLTCLLSSSTAKYLKLDEQLEIRWTTENSIATLDVLASIGHKDWVGIGFSDYGDIRGADLCVFWRDWKGKIFFSDVQVSGEGLVSVDQQNDCGRLKWRLRQVGSSDREESKPGALEYIYLRPFHTCDPADYRLDEGTTHLVWAIGRGPLYRLHGLNITEANNARTGMTRTRFIDVETVEDAVSRPFLVQQRNLSVPSTDTTYWCSVLKLPTIFNRKHHVTEYRPYISKDSLMIVHHMEVFHCEGEDEFPLWSGPCGDESAPEALKKCKKVLAAWAIGAGPFQYPSQAGLSLGGPEFSPYVLLEVHYNNHDLVEGVVDNSGIQFQVTQELRKYDAGIMELGLEYNNKMAVPPAMSEFTLAGTCAPECTAVGLPETGIVIFGSQLHTHGAGKRVQTTLVRDGVESIVNIDRHYSTHFQEIRLLVAPVHLLPGDALVTSCLYSTQDRSNITLGGFGFTEEMCVNYIHYYPKVDLEVCKSSVEDGDLLGYFEKLNLEEGQDSASNKSIEDNYFAIRWNKRRSADLDLLYKQSTLSMQCMRGDGTPLQGTWRKIPQVKIREKYEPEEEPCILPENIKKDDKRRENRLKRREENKGIEKKINIKKDIPSEDFNEKKKRMDHVHNHMHKRFRLNRFSDDWDDYDAWGVDKKDGRRSVHLGEVHKLEANNDDLLEANNDDLLEANEDDFSSLSDDQTFLFENYNYLNKRSKLGSM